VVDGRNLYSSLAPKLQTGLALQGYWSDGALADIIVNTVIAIMTPGCELLPEGLKVSDGFYINVPSDSLILSMSFRLLTRLTRMLQVSVLLRLSLISSALTPSALYCFSSP